MDPKEIIKTKNYEQYVGKKILDQLEKLAEPLQGRSWTHVNSTPTGGGVAEMLQSEIPLLRGLGLNAHWHVIEGDQEFFSVTKKFHNLIQGVKDEICIEEIFHTYLDMTAHNATKIKIISDMVTIHDPQPAALINCGHIYGHLIWRCHIDTTEASRRVWRFLLPYINHYSGAIFSTPGFAKQDLRIPAYEIAPSIDPHSEKNKIRNKKECLNILQEVFHENDIDPKRPIVLAVSRYDVHKNQKGIIQSFKILKEKLDKDIMPVLIILGNSASDDPEGMKMFNDIRNFADEDQDIYFLLNAENNDQVVGSLMAIADCFVHISTKEGFGLVVTEALWQGTPVIGSRIGGIPKQVVDQETGYLVEPYEHEKIAQYMQLILEDRALRNTLSQNAQEHVRNNFLLPHMVAKELLLMRYYLDIDELYPTFRINEMSYNEIRNSLYSRNHQPISKEELRKRIFISEE